MSTRNGYVIRSFDKGPLAAVLFAGRTEPLYLFPRTLLTPTEEERQTLSKSQLNKRQQTPLVGEFYEFKIEPAPDIIIKGFQKDAKRKTVVCHISKVLYNDKCVISPTPARICWVEAFGIISNIPKQLLHYLLPNITIAIALKLEIDFGHGVDQTALTTLDGLRPVVEISFNSFGDLIYDDDLDYYVSKAPWNRINPMLGIGFIDLDERPDTPDEIVDGSHKTPHGLPLFFQAVGVVLEANKMFCKLRPEEPFYVPTVKPRDYFYGIGVAQNIAVRWESLTRRYIVVENFFHSTLRTERDHTYQNGTTLFLVYVKKSDKFPKPGYYYNDLLGLIFDPTGVLANEGGRKLNAVWVKYVGPRTKYAFTIVKKAVVSEEAVECAKTWRPKQRNAMPDDLLDKLAKCDI